MPDSSQAHFINNQLAVVLGSAHMLESRAHDPYTKDQCARIRDAVSKISDSVRASLAGSSGTLAEMEKAQPTRARKTGRTARNQGSEIPFKPRRRTGNCDQTLTVSGSSITQNL
jgi:predicted lipid-binding transport protein (Tim44 family)